MRWLLGLLVLVGCTHGRNGVRLGDRVRFTDGFYEGCIGTAVNTLWDDTTVFNTTCFVNVGRERPRILYDDCYKLEVLDRDLQAFVGCPSR